MYIQLNRLMDNGESTIGTVYVNGEFESFSIEDTKNEPKIYGKTRIPSGTYNIKLRTEGRMNLKYSDRYANHKGMLWLQNVENFEWVYIHVGNNSDDTDGCILLGNVCRATSGKQEVQGSSLAYMSLYTKAIESFNRNEEVTIEII